MSNSKEYAEHVKLNRVPRHRCKNKHCPVCNVEMITGDAKAVSRRLNRRKNKQELKKQTP